MRTVPFPGDSGRRTLRIWEPDSAPRAIVLISHGMAEHITRYGEFARRLAARGFIAAGANHLGHGEEAGILGYFADSDGWGRAVEDLHAAMSFLSSLAPGAKKVLFGHSAGSFLAREYALRYPEELDALVLSATGWHPKALCLTGLSLAGLMCGLGFRKKPSRALDALSFSANNKAFASQGGTKFDWLSRDAAEVRRYADDPLCGFVFTAGGFKDLFTGLLALADTGRQRALPPRLPVYLMSGSEDPVGGRGKGVETIASQYRAAGLSEVTLKLYPGARHELLHETNRDEAIADLLAWLDGVVN